MHLLMKSRAAGAEVGVPAVGGGDQMVAQESSPRGKTRGSQRGLPACIESDCSKRGGHRRGAGICQVGKGDGAGRNGTGRTFVRNRGGEGK